MGLIDRLHRLDDAMLRDGEQRVGTAEFLLRLDEVVLRIDRRVATQAEAGGRLAVAQVAVIALAIAVLSAAAWTLSSPSPQFDHFLIRTAVVWWFAFGLVALGLVGANRRVAGAARRQGGLGAEGDLDVARD